GPGARTDRQRVRCIVPCEWNARELAALVAIRAPVVFVEREPSIASGVHVQRHLVARLVADVLLIGSDRNNRARADEEGHRLERRFGGGGCAARELPAGPEVVPRADWQIYLAASRLVLDHGIHQEPRADHALSGAPSGL